MYRKKQFVAVNLGLVVALTTSAALAGPIPNGAQLYLERTLSFPEYAIYGLAWHQGQLWTADQSGILRRIDPVSGAIYETLSTGCITHNGLGSDGTTLYMTYDPGGNTWFKPVLPSGPSIQTPTSGARDMTAQGGGLWYADVDNGKIVKMSTSGTELAKYSSPFGPGGNSIEWDGLHLLHTAHSGSSLAFINPTNGNEDEDWPRIDMSSFPVGGGIAWDGQWLYGANADRIYVIGVVPEPTSLALLAVAGLGLMMRRRRGR